MRADTEPPRASVSGVLARVAAMVLPFHHNQIGQSRLAVSDLSATAAEWQNLREREHR